MCVINGEIYGFANGWLAGKRWGWNALLFDWSNWGLVHHLLFGIFSFLDFLIYIFLDVFFLSLLEGMCVCAYGCSKQQQKKGVCVLAVVCFFPSSSFLFSLSLVFFYLSFVVGFFLFSLHVLPFFFCEMYFSCNFPLI